MNMTSSQPYWGPILFVSILNLQYDESVSFLLRLLSPFGHYIEDVIRELEHILYISLFLL